jgi:hypothetical protein
MPSREAKIAMKAPAAAGAAPRQLASDPSQRTTAETRERQQRVWDYVAHTIRALSADYGSNSTATPSPSSLEIALEDRKLQEAQEAFMKELRPAGEKDADIIGYVFAVNQFVEKAAGALAAANEARARARGNL